MEIFTRIYKHPEPSTLPMKPTDTDFCTTAAEITRKKNQYEIIWLIRVKSLQERTKPEI